MGEAVKLTANAAVQDALEAADQCITDLLDVYGNGGSMAVLDLAVKSLRDDARKRVRAALSALQQGGAEQ